VRRAALPDLAAANDHRSRAAAREFQRMHPCPSTGKTSGLCPGYRKDYVVPLACDGADVAEERFRAKIPAQEHRVFKTGRSTGGSIPPVAKRQLPPIVHSSMSRPGSRDDYAAAIGSIRVGWS
jgi:hypothetical protein